MAEQKGRDLVIKLGDGASPETFNTIGGATSGTITANNNTVDITSKDDAGVRNLLEGLFGKAFTVSLSGFFSDDTHIGTLRTNMLAGTETNFQVVIPGSSSNGTYEGPFIITSLEETGEVEGAVQYSVTMESSGAVTFT